MSSIMSSVGKRGVNTKDDVLTIRTLLSQIKPEHGGPTVPLKPWPGADPALIQAIEQFQRFQFGYSTGLALPDEATIHQLNMMVTNQIPPEAMQKPLWATLMESARSEVVRVAGFEADRPDHVTGVRTGDPKSKQTPQGAARLREYFTVFPAGVGFPPEEFEKGKPGGCSWCGIFATWVLNQILKNMSFKGGNRDPGIYSGGTRLQTRKDSRYGVGDICLTTEDGVCEPWPTHHFIVAGPPVNGKIPTIEGNQWNAATGLRHAVVRNTRLAGEYGYYPLVQDAKL